MSVTVYFLHGLIIFYIVSIIHFNLYDAACIESHQYQSEIAHNFSEAIAAVVRTYFRDKRLRDSFNIQIKAQNVKNLQFFQEIIDGTIKMLGNTIGVTLGNNIPIAISEEMHYSVLLVDSVKSLKLLYLNIMKYDLHIYGSYFIVLHSLCSPSHYYTELSDILRENWLAGISHADILVHAVNNVILLFHGVPFTTFHCGTNAPVAHNKFTDGQWQHTNFYVSKSNNLHGCPLVCATWEDMPYFKLAAGSTKDKPIFIGIEGKLLEYLAHRMNFTLTMRWMTEAEINQTIYDEHGLMTKLFATGTDFAVGAFHHKSTTLHDSYTPTRTYYLSTYYFVVSSIADPYDPFEKLLLPFTIESWAVVISVYIIGNSVIYLVSHLGQQWKSLILGTRNRSPFFNMIAISLGEPITREPKVSFSRFLLMVWMLATFVLRSVYEGLMFKFIKHDLHKPPPKTIKQLISGYKMLMTEIVYHYVDHIPWLEKNYHILNTSEVKSFDMLRNPVASADEKLAILSAEEYFGYYQHHFNVAPDDFYLVPEVLFTQQLSIYMKKNSIFLNRFNIHIESYINEGLLIPLERVFIPTDRNYRRRVDNHAKAMNLQQLYGAINLLLIGLSLCLCVFASELGVFGLTACCRSARKVLQRLTKKRRQRRIQIEFTN